MSKIPDSRAFSRPPRQSRASYGLALVPRLLTSAQRPPAPADDSIDLFPIRNASLDMRRPGSDFRAFRGSRNMGITRRKIHGSTVGLSHFVYSLIIYLVPAAPP